MIEHFGSILNGILLMVKEIITYGNLILRKKSEEITFKKRKDQKQLVSDLFETLDATNGIGLAAPQIGINKRVFVIDTTKIPNYDKGIRMAFINPVLYLTSNKIKSIESCLSIPGISEFVYRYTKVKIDYYDPIEKGYYQSKIFNEIEATVIQHEFDHLDGILFIDRVSPISKIKLSKKLKNLQK